jgi:tRNA (guanine-N7-)-methyltransferase
MPEPTARQRTPRRSYADAPRLPEADAYDLRQLFPASGADSGVDLEIGCARGGFLLERLARDAHVRLVGIEIQLKAATLAAQKVEQRGFSDRCRVFAGDVRVILPKVLPQSVQRVFVHFPDPWWKKRHTKRRLASLELMQQIERILQFEGELFIQTDVDQLALAFTQALSLTDTLVPMRDAANLDHNPYGACSPREKQAMDDGLPIHRVWYRKLSTPP